MYHSSVRKELQPPEAQQLINREMRSSVYGTVRRSVRPSGRPSIGAVQQQQIPGGSLDATVFRLSYPLQARRPVWSPRGATLSIFVSLRRYFLPRLPPPPLPRPLRFPPYRFSTLSTTPGLPGRSRLVSPPFRASSFLKRTSAVPPTISLPPARRHGGLMKM